jgi:chromosome segregation ATPase
MNVMTNKPYSTNKPRGWLKNILNDRTESKIVLNYSQEDSEGEPADNVNSSKLDFSFLEQDKTALDIVVAVENLLNDRQLSQFKSKDTEDQLSNATETINRLKNELNKKEHMILEKEKEFRTLEDKLTSKQMSYDQLLEDYKDYQGSTNTSIENLKYQLEKERNKYSQLNDEFSKHQYDSIQKFKELEETLRDTGAENTQISSQYQKVLEEKTELLKTVTDFTERMSFSFSPPSK